MGWRLVSFLVHVDGEFEDYEYDEIREQIGSGEADLYKDEPADWAEGGTS